MTRISLIGAALISFIGHSFSADTPPETKPAKPRAFVMAVRVDTPPVIDGRMDDEVWTKAQAAGDFAQINPLEGVPMTERTEFRVLYDDDALYIGFWCYDSEPKKILARTLTRDDWPDEDDFINFAIDPFLDRRNGYLFAFNPNGARFDAIINNNAYAGSSWDTIWECQAQITNEGWFCEIKLPFDSLAFSPNNTSWGINVGRTIRRKNEEGRWHNATRHLYTSSVSEAGDIRGLENLGKVNKWEITPYATGKYQHDHLTGDGDTLGDFGGDISYRISSNMNATLSVNTDFAETEVDTRQLNFTRFSLMYPEKRDFFLKDSGIFHFGPQMSRSSSGSLPSTPFFSRRIGLTRSGRPVPINLASKVTGRFGDYNVGVIGAMVDDHGDLDSQNAFVTRVSKNVLEQSTVGIISTVGDPNSDMDTYMLGTDFNYRTTKFLTDKTLQASVYSMANYDETTDWSYAHGTSLSYPNEFIRTGLSYYQIDDDFKPRLGYTRRTGVRRFGSNFSIRPRTENISWLRKYSLSYYNSLYTTLENQMESQKHSFYIPHLDFESGYDFSFEIEREFDRPDRDFTVSGGGKVPAGEYWWTDYNFDVDLPDAGMFNGGFGYVFGDWYHGEKDSIYARVGYNPFKWLNTSVRYSHSGFELPDAEFDAQISSLNLRFNFTPDMGWSHLVQHDNISDSVGYSTRFFWEFQPGKKAYVVFRQNYGDEDDGSSLRDLYVRNSELSIKAQTTFRF